MDNDLDIKKDTRLNPLLATLSVLALIYLPALIDLVRDWYTDANYSHGFLIPIVSGYLIWQKRELLQKTPVRTDRRGLIVVIVGLILFILGNGAAEYFTLRFSFVLTLFGVVYFTMGPDIIRAIWFELAFLIFMIPIPYVIYYAVTFPLQLLASKITAAFLEMIGMAVYRQGNIIHIEGYSLEVAEACSGMRSIVSLLALGALYARMSQKRITGQIILFFSTVPIAVIANIIRVMISSLIAYTITNRITDEPLHSIMGLSVFIVAFALLFIFGGLLKRILK